MTASVIDLESAKASRIEAIRGNQRFASARLSDDRESVILSATTGELTVDAAETLARQMLELVAVARGNK